mmetsp:Transcript_9168/g.27059  ORF Transcript_9168/g.27059 Transcript_9168/m.27059 type:complete len:629 (-) Transcript_9168:217-2103(-)
MLAAIALVSPRARAAARLGRALVPLVAQELEGAGRYVEAAARTPPRVQDEEAAEEGHLQHVDHHGADGGGDAKERNCGQVHDCPGEHGEEGGDRGDGDGRAGEGHAVLELLRDGAPRVCSLVEGVGDDDHVVHAHAEQRVAHEGRHGREGDAHGGGEAKARRHGERGGEGARRAQGHAGPPWVASEATEHHADKDKYEAHARPEQGAVALDQGLGLARAQLLRPVRDAVAQGVLGRRLVLGGEHVEELRLPRVKRLLRHCRIKEVAQLHGLGCHAVLPLHQVAPPEVHALLDPLLRHGLAPLVVVLEALARVAPKHERAHHEAHLPSDDGNEPTGAHVVEVERVRRAVRLHLQRHRRVVQVKQGSDARARVEHVAPVRAVDDEDAGFRQGAKLVGQRLPLLRKAPLLGHIEMDHLRFKLGAQEAAREAYREEERGHHHRPRLPGDDLADGHEDLAHEPRRALVGKLERHARIRVPAPTGRAVCGENDLWRCTAFETWRRGCGVGLATLLLLLLLLREGGGAVGGLEVLGAPRLGDGAGSALGGRGRRAVVAGVALLTRPACTAETDALVYPLGLRLAHARHGGHVGRRRVEARKRRASVTCLGRGGCCGGARRRRAAAACAGQRVLAQ